MTRIELYLHTLRLAPNHAEAHFALGIAMKVASPAVPTVALPNGAQMTRQDLYRRAFELQSNTRNAGSYAFALAETLPRGGSIAINGVATTQKDLLLKAIHLNNVPEAYFQLAELTTRGSVTLLDGKSLTAKQLLLHAIKHVFLDEEKSKYYLALAGYLGDDEDVTLLDNQRKSKEDLCREAMELDEENVAAYHALADVLGPNGFYLEPDGTRITARILRQRADRHLGRQMGAQINRRWN